MLAALVDDLIGHGKADSQIDKDGELNPIFNLK